MDIHAFSLELDYNFSAKMFKRILQAINKVREAYFFKRQWNSFILKLVRIIQIYLPIKELTDIK